MSAKGIALGDAASTPHDDGRYDGVRLIILIIGLVLLCMFAGGLARYLWFVVVLASGFYAWRRSLTFHLQTAMVVFAIAPLLRRVVDLNAGYEPSAEMLAAPLLMLLVPVAGVVIGGKRRSLQMGSVGRPFLLALACASYAIGITTLLDGDLKESAACAVKLLIPVLYGYFLIGFVRLEPQLVPRVRQTLFWIILALSFYGIQQFISPMPWDRDWMINSRYLIWSIGDPEPYKVRVFSTMASPASFATLASVGCLLMAADDWRGRNRWHLIFRLAAAIPMVIALFLTTYRTAWSALAVGILFLILVPSTRLRGALLICFAILAIAAATTWNLSQGVVSRLETFATGMQGDDSSVARIRELWDVYDDSDTLMFGRGYSEIYPVNPYQPIDGTIVEAVRVTGVFVGSALLLALVWTVAQAAVLALQDGTPRMASLGAINIGALALLPLASIVDNELGFFFWAFAGMAAGLGSMARVSDGATLPATS